MWLARLVGWLWWAVSWRAGRRIRICHQAAQHVGVRILIRIIVGIIIAALDRLDLLYLRRIRPADIGVHASVEQRRDHLIPRLGKVVGWLILTGNKERDLHLIASRH